MNDNTDTDTDTDDDRLAEVFEQYHDDEMTDPTDHHPLVSGRTGTGKLKRLGELLARRFADDPELEWIDPKGDPQDNTTGGDA